MYRQTSTIRTAAKSLKRRNNVAWQSSTSRISGSGVNRVPVAMQQPNAAVVDSLGRIRSLQQQQQRQYVRSMTAAATTTTITPQEEAILSGCSLAVVALLLSAAVANSRIISGNEVNSCSCSAAFMTQPYAVEAPNATTETVALGKGLQDRYYVNWRNVLGRGAYGCVYAGRLAATGEKVAIKSISKRFTKSKDFQREIKALQRICEEGGHENVSGLRDMYEDESNFYLVTDLACGGDMFDELVAHGAYSEKDAARLVQELSSAMTFVHDAGVVHADLKPENLLLSSKRRQDSNIKMIDFGCAHVSENDEQHPASNNNMVSNKKKVRGDRDNTGTTAYWPPERFQKGGCPDEAGDMWSVGVILYIMLTGVHPFDVMGGSSDQEVEERIKQNPRPPMEKRLVGHLSDSAIDLIQKLLECDPAKRMTAHEMLEHPWVCGKNTSTTTGTPKLEQQELCKIQTENNLFQRAFAFFDNGRHVCTMAMDD